MTEILQRDGLTVTVIETPSLGDRSYVIDDGTLALVVDPQRDLDRVHEVLASRRVTLAAVAETHLHNDYVSGGLELARTAGVPYLVPGAAEVAYDRTAVVDGSAHRVGAMDVRVLATPGHTEHHVAYTVATTGEPLFVLTGGSMLFGSVGRTDLVSAALTDTLTRHQHASVRRLAEVLPGATAVLPTHGFGSFCSATATSGTSSTVETQRTQNPALAQDEEEFVTTLVAALDAYPAYYAHMGPANAAGPAPVDLTPVADADAAEVRRRLDAGEWVVDLRDRTAFARGHVPGTLGFDAEGNMVTYLGWLIPWGTPLTLIGDSPEQVADAQRELVRIGIDRPVASTSRPVGELADTLASFPRATFADLGTARRTADVHVLDVRRGGEWRESHLDGAQHIPLHELAARMDEVPSTTVWVHCAGGFRASIAASVLDAAGKDVVAIDEAFDQAEESGLPLVPGNG